MEWKSLKGDTKSQLQVLGDSDNDDTGIVLEWMGCFSDDEKHDFEWNPNGKFTMDGCMQECLFTRYSFMAIQDGDQCWCGNEYKTDFQYYQLPDSECEGTCFGNSAPEGGSFSSLGTKRCGGKRANAVYKLQMRLDQHTTTASSVTETTYTMTSNTQTTSTFTTTSVTMPHDDENKARLYDADVCEDKPTTNFSIAGHFAACSEVTHYCTEGDYAKQMETACPVTCGLCQPSWVGCFHDDEHEHDFAKNPPGKHTTKSCMAACSGFLYMGLQGGSQCWCGMKYSTNPKTYFQMIDTDCGDVCHGETDMTPPRYCGKANVNAVYRLPAVAPNAMPAVPDNRTKSEGADDVRLPITSKPSIKAHIKSFAGCFAEGPDSDGAVFLTQPKGTHTTETCLAECTNYTYMALEDMGTCWCGSKNPATTSAMTSAPEAQCGDVCHGEAGLAPVRYCGGKQVSAVYALEVPVITGVNKLLVDSEAPPAAAAAVSEQVTPVAANTTEEAPMPTKVTMPATATGNATAPESDALMDSNLAKVYTTFLQFDTDKDNAISAEELSVLGLISPTQWSSSRIQSLVFFGDTSGDGKLQFREFKTLFNDEESLKAFSAGLAPSV